MFTRLIRHVSVYVFIYIKRLTILRSLLVVVASLVSALTLNTPTSVTSGGTINISWATVAGDPYVNQTLTPSPLLTVFLALPSRWSWLTHHSMIRSPFSTVLTHRLVVFLYDARMFLLGMLYIVAVSVLCL